MPRHRPLQNNPPSLDTPAEIRERLTNRGIDREDQMETSTQDKAQFAWSLVNEMANDPPNERGGRSDRMLAAEAELVAHELITEHGVHPDADVPIDDEPGWFDY